MDQLTVSKASDRMFSLVQSDQKLRDSVRHRLLVFVTQSVVEFDGRQEKQELSYVVFLLVLCH